jgi:hypothetical protein
MATSRRRLPSTHVKELPMNPFVPIRTLSAVAAACTLALSGASVAAPTASTTAATDAPNVLTDQPNRTPAMEQLLQSADRLRQSIQALAQQSPGPHRDAAIESARQALNETQRAMIDLPPELRAYEGSLDWVEYGQAMERLKASAQELREAVHAMAREPAGERRNEAIEQANEALAETQQAMALTFAMKDAPAAQAKAGNDSSNASAASAAATSGSPGAGTNAATPSGARNAGASAALVPIVILAAGNVASDANLANGCWAKLYDEENFHGDSLAVMGPVAIASSHVGSTEWGRDYDSAKVGPHAKLTVYDNENFEQQTGVLGPSQSIGDLDAKLGPFENVRSMKLDCTA